VNSGPNNTCHPSPNSVIHSFCLDYFKFFGRLIGKAFFDGELIDTNLTIPIFKLIAGQPLFFSDFQNVDKELYMFLLRVYNFSAQELANSTLTFTCSVNDFNQTAVYELKPNGKNIDVTKENVYEFIKTFTAWRMLKSVEPQFKSFLEGIYDVVSVQVWALFKPGEIAYLLNGAPTLDIKQWKLHTLYVNFPGVVPQMSWFWEILEEFTSDQRALVLQFATGSNKIMDFASLYPRFTLYSLGAGKDALLPLGHTCFNRMDIPLYTTKDVMKAKLEKAIEYASVGFGME